MKKTKRRERVRRVWAIRYPCGDYYHNEDGYSAFPNLSYFLTRRAATERARDCEDFGHGIPRVVAIEMRETVPA